MTHLFAEISKAATKSTVPTLGDQNLEAKLLVRQSDSGALLLGAFLRHSFDALFCGSPTAAVAGTSTRDLPRSLFSSANVLARLPDGRNDERGRCL